MPSTHRSAPNANSPRTFGTPSGRIARSPMPPRARTPVAMFMRLRPPALERPRDARRTVRASGPAPGCSPRLDPRVHRGAHGFEHAAVTRATAQVPGDGLAHGEVGRRFVAREQVVHR